MINIYWHQGLIIIFVVRINLFIVSIVVFFTLFWSKCFFIMLFSTGNLAHESFLSQSLKFTLVTTPRVRCLWQFLYGRWDKCRFSFWVMSLSLSLNPYLSPLFFENLIIPYTYRHWDVVCMMKIPVVDSILLFQHEKEISWPGNPI